MKLKNCLALLFLCLMFGSCIKDEELTWEADITEAWLHVDDWSAFFYNATDTVAVINKDYASSIITFNVRKDIDSLVLTALAPQFNITPGATITPASGTTLDFSDGGQTYTVVSPGNAKSYRTYNVRFSKQMLPTYFSFDNYYLDDSGKYYVWSDYNDGEEADWGSANPGFALARGTADRDEYPSLPDPTGGVDGGACVKLTTRDLGAWGTITHKRIAAGNFFLGSFDLSQALTNTLQSTRFGLPVNFKPIRFTGYYKYMPGDEMMDRDGNLLDEEDSAALYIQLYRNHDSDGNSVVLTGENTANSDLRVGRGDVPVESTTEWKYFDIEIEYWDEVDPDLLAKMGYNLSIVCSSSKNGAYYEGAVGSTLYIDNFSIIVEE